MTSTDLKRLDFGGFNKMTILIVAPRDDLHARVVQERVLDMGVPCQIWNTTWFPWRQSLTWTPRREPSCAGEASFDFSEVGCTWWRRYRRPTVSPLLSDAHVKRFCAGEASEMLQGLVEATRVPVINNPSAERRAGLKLLQLHTASLLGLAIPDTVVSNDRDVLLQFVNTHERCIIKTLLCDYPHNFPTRECTARDFDESVETDLAPSLIQEFVPCGADVRICVVGQQLFSAELRRADAKVEPDWRSTPTGWRRHDLPDTVVEKVLCVMRALELTVASFDFRLTPSGEYFFFEVNPSGQFLFLEVDADLGISLELAQLLVKTAEESRSSRTVRSAPNS